MGKHFCDYCHDIELDYEGLCPDCLTDYAREISRRVTTMEHRYVDIKKRLDCVALPPIGEGTSIEQHLANLECNVDQGAGAWKAAVDAGAEHERRLAALETFAEVHKAAWKVTADAVSRVETRLYAVEETSDDLEDGLKAAPEGKAWDEAYVNNLRADNRKLALSNAGMVMRIAELERQLMAYRDCANCAESPVPTKRQQVAEHLLTRLQEMRACQILRVAVSDLAEGEYDVSARLVMQVVNIIEEAAREEQE